MQINPLVVDLSRYDNVTDWNKVYAAGIRGVINKATEGHDYVDMTYAYRGQPARAAGLLYGAYHFLLPGDMEVQAKHFLDTVAVDGKIPDDLLLAVDHERAEVTRSQLKVFIRAVAARAGRLPVLYSGNVIKEQLGKTIDLDLARLRLWLAQYGPNPTWPPTWQAPWLWQFTGDGVGPPPHSVDGIDTRNGIDINSYAGTVEQLKAEWTGGTYAKPQPDENPIPPPPDVEPPPLVVPITRPPNLWERFLAALEAAFSWSK